MIRLTIGAAVGAILFAGAAQAQDASSPLTLVQGFYAEATPARTDLGRFFAPDIASALETDLASRQPFVSADYRFDMPEKPSGALSFEQIEAQQGAAVNVTVDGQIVQVELCRRNDGQWRITDIRDPNEVWSTRGYMQLHLGQVACQ